MSSLMIGSPSFHRAALVLREVSSTISESVHKAVAGIAFGEFFNRLIESYEEREARRREAYLAESADIYELEYRMRKLDQEKTAQPYWMTGYL